jgi:hypothetical protein
MNKYSYWYNKKSNLSGEIFQCHAMSIDEADSMLSDNLRMDAVRDPTISTTIELNTNE